MTVTVQEVDNSATAASDSAAATVAEQPLAATAQPVGGTEGQAFTGTVATFTDGETQEQPSAYAATINWGDGTSPSAGTITGASGNFGVSGTHTYAEEGVYTVTVTVQETNNPATATSSSATATVGDAQLTGFGGGTLTEGATAFSGAVATFTDANAGAPASDFTATINWGDGVTSSGTVNGSGGKYTVGGSHTYAGAGSYTVTVSIHDDGGASTSASTKIVVSLQKLANAAPVCSAVHATPVRLWPANHKFVLIKLSGATDRDGDTLTYSITGVTQDEPVSGMGRGDQAPDAKRASSGNSVYVRAEDGAHGKGRLYFIAFKVSDGHGLSCSGTMTIAVPHSAKQKSVPNSRKHFNSFSAPTSHKKPKHKK